MSQSIIKNAKLFSKNPIRKKTLEDVVNDSLYRINALIETANRSNKTSLVYKLPESFAVPESISEEEFMLEVYFTIVNIMEAKGYTVGIRMASSGNHMSIAWDTEKADVRQWVAKLARLKF